MSKILPPGYISLREAAAVVEKAMTFGVPYNSQTAKLRTEGYDVGDQDSRDDAMDKLWLGINERKFQLYGFDPKAGRVLKIPTDIAEGIPLLSSTRVASLQFLRHRHPHYSELTTQFNVSPRTIKLTIRAIELQKFAKTIVRSRHRSKASKVGAKPRGQPKKRTKITNIIKEIVNQSKWSPLDGIKALTQRVNRNAHDVTASEDTVRRELDAVFAETKDRRFERMKRGVPSAE